MEQVSLPGDSCYVSCLWAWTTLCPYALINDMLSVQSDSTLCSCQGSSKAKDNNSHEVRLICTFAGAAPAYHVDVI